MPRELKIDAMNAKAGMTVLELMRAMSSIPHEVVPVVQVTLSGKIKQIKFRLADVADE